MILDLVELLLLPDPNPAPNDPVPEPLDQLALLRAAIEPFSNPPTPAPLEPPVNEDDAESAIDDSDDPAADNVPDPDADPEPPPDPKFPKLPPNADAPLSV